MQTYSLEQAKNTKREGKVVPEDIFTGTGRVLDTPDLIRGSSVLVRQQTLTSFLTMRIHEIRLG
jgi:hypothetical protein